MVGTQTAILKVGLKDYPLAPLMTVSWELIILTIENNLPYFKTNVAKSFEVYKTKEATKWTVELPAFVDDDPNDVVSLSLDSGTASFVKLVDQSSLEIEDISNTSVKDGFYMIKLILDDGHDELVSINISLFIFDVI